MALIDKVGRSLLSAAMFVAVASCHQQAEPSAAFQPATADDPSPTKGGDPAGALPSQVVSGAVSEYRAASPGVGLPKSRDAAGSLPSTSAAGKSAPYAPQGRAGTDTPPR